MYNVTKSKEEQAKFKTQKEVDKNGVNVPKLNLIIKEDLMK